MTTTVLAIDATHCLLIEPALSAPEAVDMQERLRVAEDPIRLAHDLEIEAILLCGCSMSLIVCNADGNVSSQLKRRMRHAEDELVRFQPMPVAS